MAVTADPAAQRRLLDLARIDREINAAGHRRRTLPELAVIEAVDGRLAELTKTRVLADAEVGDLDRAARKLDTEIDQVRARADRDAARLAAGGGPAKDLENLQREIESLARRQLALEDDALELMERRETADAALAEATAALERASAERGEAIARRDTAYAEIDAATADLAARRTGLLGELPPALAALYEQIHGSGQIAAGGLTAGRCQACRMGLDMVALSEIRSAAADSVVHCPECGAILVRS